MHMKVELLSYPHNPQKLIYAAARQCYSKQTAAETFRSSENLSSEKIARFIEHLIRRGHLSPLEHVNFTFAVEGISRVCSHQLVRHRLASYSQQSQRYVDMDQFPYITPKAVRDHPEGNKKFQAAVASLTAAYQELKQLLERTTELNREQINQDLRFLLPQAAETKIVLTMNVRELFHFFGERLCIRAQWEIRSLAAEMLGACNKILPEAFRFAGPKCARYGYCPEHHKECPLNPSPTA
ncbi:MAG: FAD-dependent thymidylate synthase [Candidatus Omnitrophica bacterium]|nr:FAD-dependent thymidylate synthase [Candidatus Omnitrophota bacterium]